MFQIRTVSILLNHHFVQAILIIALMSSASGIDSPGRYDYKIDLQNVKHNRFQVELICSSFASDTLVYYFPWIIPGTYAEANYGKYIHKLVAVDQEGETIRVKKKGKNTFIITPANKIQSIKYWVSATWASRSLKTIWPMAGTGIQADRIYALNAGGVFGYFENQEGQPVEMDYTYPPELYAMTVLDQESKRPGKTFITAADYHELIDSPIMFAKPDTTSFKIHDTEVLVGFAHESDDTPRAVEITSSLKPSMTAIGAYIDSLPAEKYAYLIYYSDARALGKILDKPRFLLFKGLGYVLRHGIPIGGALEHNKSSFYYLPDPGPGYTEQITKTIEDIAIHEFMHILTPLNLSSQFIHNWDYNEPELSKHLWLYEGVTEYLSKIIQVNGGILTPGEFLAGTMRNKIYTAEEFPLEDMSFTEMSTQVLDKPYKKQYNQVYQRGAVMGMLLDIEIIRLTEGRKRLIDVMLELVDEYGTESPMDEASIFDIFTEKVHPELRTFFSKYIEGREVLPYQEILDHVGVSYVTGDTISIPRHPWKDNGVTMSGISLGHQRTIRKVSKQDVIGFQAGDKVERKLYRRSYFDDFGSPLLEGMLIPVPVERDGEEIVLYDTLRYKEDDALYELTILKEMTPLQSKYFNIWLGFEDPIDTDPID